MPRMRTIDKAYEEIHANDPASAVSKRYIRQLVVTGEIPARMAGRKYILNFDALENYLSGEKTEITRRA